MTRWDNQSRYRSGQPLPGTPDLARLDERLAAHGVKLGVVALAQFTPGAHGEVRAAVETICAGAQPGSVDILPGKLVIEIKPAGINKADAVCELMSFSPFADRNPIFIGDDTTDEPVFGIISRFGGLGFSVGRVFADANGHFDKPESVRAWLARIAAEGAAE